MSFKPFKRSGALPQQIFTRRPSLMDWVNAHPTMAACFVILAILLIGPAIAEAICALTGAPSY